MKRGSLVAFAMAAVVVFSLSGCGLMSGASTAARPQCGTRMEQVKTMNNETTSRLDEAGLKEIRATCRVTFDLSEGSLSKRDLGLADEYHVRGIQTDGLMTLRLRGSKGDLEARTDHVTFFDERADVTEIAYFLAADTVEEFFAMVREGADDYGFDQEAVERWIRETRDYYPDQKDKYALQPGYKLGFQVVYDLRYKGPGHVNTIIVSVDPSAEGTDK